ncbi:hypothetical protein BpHYR1_051287 [Brachionus plicatilis]|uniref:Apple domain-containing protein n=1 Tax=Brachionus plicatilis TaxID=10195 RepID=A0A3M7S8F6_BRAPC|nr:hypothetical protein BpHYR1_051287 [Brachionus plicatilis]
MDRCWIELSTLYIGENLGEYIITSIDECCRACQLNSECQSWVYHNLDQTCQLKKSLRSTYFIANDYTSGFLKRPYDTFIKVSNSLGLTNSNQTTFDNIKENIFNLWFRYLFSNINRICISYESEEFIYDNKLIQVVTYLLQLDPRISQNSQILMKLVNKVNSTLYADPDFYNTIVANLTTDDEIVAYVLPSTQISVIEIFQNQSHVTDEEGITSSIPKVTTEFMTSADLTLQTSSQQSQTDMTSQSSTTPLTTSFEIAAYQSGNCFIETNVNYISESAEDDLISFYTENKEKCCLNCNRLEMCRSWSFETTSQTCVLKAGYRSNPTVEPSYESGFKPSDLFTLSVTRGLEFVNLNNSIYDLLLNYTIESGFDEREIYLLIKTRLEQNILEIFTENENVTFIQQILVTNLFYNISSLLVDYDLNIDPRFNEKIADILFLMNDLYATPNKSDKEFSRLKLPLENEDEPGIIVRS